MQNALPGDAENKSSELEFYLLKEASGKGHHLVKTYGWQPFCLFLQKAGF